MLCGVGLAITRFVGGDEAISMVATTPIDNVRSMFRMTNWVPRGDHVGDDLPPQAVRRIDEQFKQAKRDHVIWEHMNTSSILLSPVTKPAPTRSSKRGLATCTTLRP